MLWLTIPKKIKVAKPVPESLAFIGFEKLDFTSKIDLIKYNLRFTEGFMALFAIVTTLHGGVFYLRN
jgi:hypothetical protein